MLVKENHVWKFHIKVEIVLFISFKYKILNK